MKVISLSLVHLSKAFEKHKGYFLKPSAFIQSFVISTTEDLFYSDLTNPSSSFLIIIKLVYSREVFTASTKHQFL